MNIYKIYYYDSQNENTKLVWLVASSLEDVEKYIANKVKCYITSITVEAHNITILNKH